jgi:sugar phosphate isomerase/epimerase
MQRQQIALELRGLRLPLRKALHTAAELGVAAVEIDAGGEIKPQEISATGRRQLRKTVEDLGLRVAALGFRTRSGYNVAENLERRVAATKEAQRLAHDLGAAIVVNQVGRIPEEDTDPAWRMLVEALTDIGAQGDRVGAWLAAETGGESGPTLGRLLDALPPGARAVALNPGNLIVNGFSLSEAVDVLSSAVRYAYANDGVQDRARGRGVEVPLGRGSVDFPVLAAALEEHGYRGYFAVQRQHCDDPLTEVSQAVQYLRNL